MNDLPPFADHLRSDLLDGIDGYEQRVRRRSRIGVAVGAVALLAAGFTLMASQSGDTIEATEQPDVSSVTTSPTNSAEGEKTEDGSAATDISQCLTDDPTTASAQLESRSEQFQSWYNAYDVDLIVSMVGDGKIIDPSLELGREEPYQSVADWLGAAADIGDQLAIEGIGWGDPFQLFASRSNRRLAEAGIESLSVTVSVWSNPECDVRIEFSNEISSPDPCTYDALVADGCDDPFEPRMAHHAVWTGEELLIQGGSSGTHSDSGLATGLAYNPADGTSRAIAPAPTARYSWPETEAYWTGKRMIVAGYIMDDEAEEGGVHVLSYYPADDRWTVSDPLPEQRFVGPGATAFSGSELFLFGGSINDPRDTAWSFDLNSNSWKQLPDPGTPAVEESGGVWAGSEAVFYGGYTGAENAVHVAYNPATNQWRQLPIDDQEWIQSHSLLWTGSEILVVGGNTGPAHDTSLRVFDLEAETWRQSAPIPIPSAGDPAPVWTGDRLLIWGGHGTYGLFDDNGDQVYGQGAVYDPATDTWTETETSPLDDRCHHSGTWTDVGYVVFGGITICGDPGVRATGTAAIYQPEADSWELVDR